MNVRVFEKDIQLLKSEDLMDFDVIINAMGAGTQDPILY